jgi:integrase
MPFCAPDYGPNANHHKERRTYGCAHPKKEKPKPIFNKIVKKWLAVSANSCKPSTLERYEEMYTAYVRSKIGASRVDQITRSDVSDILLGMHRKGLSRATIDLARCVITGPMKYARFEGLITEDPSSGVMGHLKIARKTKRSNEMKVTEPAQEKLFLAACLKYRPDFYHLFAFQLIVGARIGEALALDWSDIDFQTKTVTISKSMRRELSTTKTGDQRKVGLGEPLADMLRRLKADRMRDDKGKASPQIFPHKNGGYLHQSSVRNAMKQVLIKADLPHFRVHDLKHTCASEALRKGTPIQIVSHQLGHRSINTTMDFYAHFIPANTQDFVTKHGAELLDPSAESFATDLQPPTKKAVITLDYSPYKLWCRRGDSNSHVETHTRP